MSYNTLVQFMNEWNWLLSGLSAGAFAIFFNWFITRKQADNNKKALIYFVLIELRTNYERITEQMKALSMVQRNLHPFVSKHEWNNARNSLTYILPSIYLAKIKLTYQTYTKIENRLCQAHLINIPELVALYNLATELTYGAMNYLNNEVEEKIDLPEQYKFNQH